MTGLNDEKIYYELNKIYQNKEYIENHLFQKTHVANPKAYEYVNYDLSTSYFVGYKCKLSAFGKGKIECHGRRQVLLGVLINDEGYPFKWDVFPGNTAEVKTLKKNILALKDRFKLNDSNVTLVFDRGIISEDNGDLIDNAGMKYISALDRNQIPGCGINLAPFDGLSVELNEPPTGYKVYDEDLYFIDEGVLGKKRFIVGFNPSLFREDRICREEKLKLFDTFLKEENKSLKKAKKNREYNPTKNRIVGELKRLKIRKYYEDPILHPLTVSKKLKDGTPKSINSYRIEIKKKQDAIKTDELLDGLCVFVTNHTERQGAGYKISPSKIIKAYRDKTKIEDVFKNMKSFLKIRPFFVNTDEHVKAVYTICVLSYFINKYLANQRKEIDGKDFLNSKELYIPFKDIDYVTLQDKNTGQTIKTSVELPERTKKLLKNLELQDITLDPVNIAS